MLIIRSLLVLALCAGTSPAAAALLEGRARVIDGDTLEIAGERVRLFGVDAPERDQDCGDRARRWACGVWATQMLTSRVSGRIVRCEGEEQDRYGRLLATCDVDGTDLGRYLVWSGAALAYRRYSTRYVAEEGEAEASGIGLWSGPMRAPEDHRRGEDTSVTDGCAIKGNISQNGRIYHLPGQPDYARTRINKEGERMFCSEDEARAAGFRPARN